MKWPLVICFFLFFGENAWGERDLFPTMYGEVETPAAAAAMCDEFPSECIASHERDPVVLTPERYTELMRINREVNEQMMFITDWDQHRLDEKWTFDEARGDCEEFAAVKRHRLITLGWPASMLLTTVVQRQDKRMHAVLAVRTSEGDLILDYKLRDGSTKVWYWYDIPAYTFVAQQSSENPRRWVSLLPQSVIDTDWRFQRWALMK